MTDQINDGGPAFPNPALANESCSFSSDVTGMTLRDWFAGQAPVDVSMAANAAKIGPVIPFGERRALWSAMAELRYEYADAMLAARAKP